MAIKYPQSQGQTSAISSAALAGAIIGQLTFGSLADRLGRRAIFVSTITIVIVGALGSATVVESEVINIYTQLTLWLLLLGLGIGGEYPLSEFKGQGLMVVQASGGVERGALSSSLSSLYDFFVCRRVRLFRRLRQQDDFPR